MARSHTPLVSIRLMWPFARLVRNYPDALPSLSHEGLAPAEYANPETRVPMRVAHELLARAVERTNNPALGLRAAELVEPGDFDALEYTARTSANVRDAGRCVARYARLLSDAVEMSFVETSDTAALRFRYTDPQQVIPAASNDFFVSNLLFQIRRMTGKQNVVEEAHFMHPPTSYLEEYARVLHVPVRFNASHNALVGRREWLDTPMLQANPRVYAAFEGRLRTRLDSLADGDLSVADSVRRLLFTQLGQGEVSMTTLARKLAMSVATLRRRLDAEGVSYTELLDGLRRELAEQHLRTGVRGIDEIAFLLGFADVVSFHKAWKRWTGTTPNEFRSKHRANAASAPRS